MANAYTPHPCNIEGQRPPHHRWENASHSAHRHWTTGLSNVHGIAVQGVLHARQQQPRLQLLQTHLNARNRARTERRRSLGVGCARGTTVVVVLSVDHLKDALGPQQILYRLITIPPLFFQSASYRESGLDEFKHLVA